MSKALSVSVIVPVFNGAAYLQECLDSILAQTRRPLEILVLDDASTDDTPRIAESYGSAIDYRRHEENLGQFNNVDYGIELSSGQLVAVFHADDVYDETILERESEFLCDHPEVGAVFCQDRFLDADGATYGQLQLPEDVPTNCALEFPVVLDRLLRYTNCFLRTPGAMVRREVYRAVGKNREREFETAADLDMWVRIARFVPIAILDAHLYGYRHSGGGADSGYRHMKTRPDHFFAILDQALAAYDGPLQGSSLAAYEAHRSKDRLFIAMNHYIAGDRNRARSALDDVSLRELIRTPAIPRARCSALYCGMTVLTRIPRIPGLADAMYRRWHGRTEAVVRGDEVRRSGHS